MGTDLQSFVYQSLKAGIARKEIKKTLNKAGWKNEEITDALNKYQDIDFPIPVPKREPYLSAREAFLLLIVFTTLYISAINLGILFFQFINYWLPDVLQVGQSYSEQAVRVAVSSLIIAFPVFLAVSWLKEKSFAHTTEKYNSKINRWLTYITLFITAVIMIVDLITLVYNLLNGELTPRFLLKVLAVLLIAGTIFTYYLLALRRGEKGIYITARSAIMRTFLGILIGIYLLSAGFGIWLVGIPSQQRLKQFDQRRINDLQSISSAVDQYWNQSGMLPASIEELANQRYSYVSGTVDPATQEPYAYRTIDADTFELCATFDADSFDPKTPQIAEPFRYDSNFWEHSAGYTCFPIDVIKNNEKPIPIR